MPYQVHRTSARIADAITDVLRSILRQLLPFVISESKVETSSFWRRFSGASHSTECGVCNEFETKNVFVQAPTDAHSPHCYFMAAFNINFLCLLFSRRFFCSFSAACEFLFHFSIRNALPGESLLSGLVAALATIFVLFFFFPRAKPKVNH